MADIAVKYLIDSARGVEDNSGARFTETYLVENLSGRTAHFDALGAAGLPQWDDPLGNGLYVINRSTRPFKDSKTQVYVDITYGTPTYSSTIPIVRYHGTTRDILTNKNRDGSLIKVNYAPGASDESVFFGGTGAPLPEQIGIARGTKALGILTFEFATFTDPSAFEEAHKKISSNPWRGKPKYTWLCNDVVIEPVLSRGGWNIAMEFLFDEDTHIEPVFYRINPGHVIPIDVDDWKPGSAPGATGDGWTNPNLLDTYDFNTLKLPTTF